MPAFKNININGAESVRGAGGLRLSAMARSEITEPQPEFETARRRLTDMSDESASRIILQTYLEDSGDDALQQITAPNRAEVVPDMLLRGIASSPALHARSLTYQQSASNIPIFGGRVVVDIDADHKTMVSINGKVAPLPDVSPIASLSALHAWERLLKWSGVHDVPDPGSPVLTWFVDVSKDRWLLVYHFMAVPFAPPNERDHKEDHACVRPRCRSNEMPFDYFVDAHSGEIAYWFSSTAGIDIPSPMTGLDCFSVTRNFYGLNGPAGYFLIDPLRNIETYDYGYQDLDKKPPFPSRAIVHPTNNMAAASPQAVSAHYHAKLVYDFYNDELKRDGIDDKGMKLISAVNVYSSGRNPLPKPQWGNAAWSQGKMWYGEENGQSFAKHLDIIAHELTHGVTATSSNLVYRDLPGALNESFSDIFGVIIANWYPARPNSVATWTWEIGPGLGAGGGPIRNFADPAAAGQPDHMSQYVPTTKDSGGVHIYSGIHNKAIYKLISGTDPAGQPSFPTRELALLLYLTLTRLTQLSDFRDSRRTLESVAGVYYANDPGLAANLALIRAAFDSVGIK
jgi:Zn-dependent metalloprotease